MKIVYYEMRKSFLKISALILLIIFTMLNILRIYDASRTQYTFTSGQFHEPYFRLYNTVCGKLNEEKLSPFRARAKELLDKVASHSYSTEYNPEEYEYTGYCFGDFNLYNTFIGKEITYCATYPNISNQIAEKAYDNYQIYKTVGNNFEAEKSAMIFNAYQIRSIPEYRATYWTNLFFNYDFSSLLCIIMLIFSLSSSFTNEKTSGMNALITAYGKNRSTTWSKLIASAIYCVFLTVYFTICDLSATHLLLGVDGLDMPLYSAEMFQFTPYNFNLWAGICLWIGQRFLALFSLSLVFLLISKTSPNTIVSMAVSFGITLILILTTAISNSILNPICALTPSTYIREFSVANLFGKPILMMIVAIVVLVVECIVLCVILNYSGASNVKYRA